MKIYELKLQASLISFILLIKEFLTPTGEFLKYNFLKHQEIRPQKISNHFYVGNILIVSYDRGLSKHICLSKEEGLSKGKILINIIIA